MAGQPLKRAMLRQIERWGGLDAICERYANGKTLQGIAEEIQADLQAEEGTPYTISRVMLNTLLLRPENITKWQEAKRSRALSHSDDAQRIADDANELDIKRAELRIKTRQFEAMKLDRETWGEKTQPTVSINVGAIFLDALKEVNNRRISQIQANGSTATIDAAVQVIEAAQENGEDSDD